ncbi:uncharacterized protein LOC110041943 [Paramuricea clavata]|uniref:Uncharacterized protein LOC110041943 n=1 Tax=Paramuricea clavata TaxID=317549 RepID=A0A6S7JMF0_PARCT|nr:uncharacterized protein LOC110041943 [Paramuricea clavata]
MGGQQYWNDHLWQLQKQYDQVYVKAPNASASPECMDQVRFYGCRYTFPGCDRSTSAFKSKKFCKDSCLHFTKECSTFLKAWKDLYLSGNPDEAYRFSCLKRPLRNAGDSPECVYYERKESLEKEDCLYLNGSSYHGNISVTSSGIPCQSWTEQCPHRHTMNKTYPELNNAKNYCRNPKNSGQRPWCFTTDRNKRWEYCDIPKCVPVDGNYGNWSLSSSCSVTCGEGFETWTRECNNPEPKYGGRNCNHLGEPVEFRPCTKNPCLVNGGYSSWSLSSQCNVTCGQGEEIWRRSCDNPTPKNGGRNYTVLGKDVEYRICKRRPCPVDGNYSNWTKSSACSVTCGVGYEMWSRKCDNPPPKHGGDCSKYGKDRESRPCRMEPCPVTSSSAKVIRITCGVCASIIVMAISFSSVKEKSGLRDPKEVIEFLRMRCLPLNGCQKAIHQYLLIVQQENAYMKKYLKAWGKGIE